MCKVLNFPNLRFKLSKDLRKKGIFKEITKSYGHRNSWIEMREQALILVLWHPGQETHYNYRRKTSAAGL